MIIHEADLHTKALQQTIVRALTGEQQIRRSTDRDDSRLVSINLKQFNP
jgi:protein involved in polysaccharide export with SLBB domain